MKNEFLKYILDMTSLGWTFEFSKEPFNLTIKVRKDGIEKESWLPYSDHCDQETVIRCMAFMVDEILQEQNKTHP
jgi:hypothetical protein